LTEFGWSYKIAGLAEEPNQKRAISDFTASAPFPELPSRLRNAFRSFTALGCFERKFSGGGEFYENQDHNQQLPY
jgi:hypothetical protein